MSSFSTVFDVAVALVRGGTLNSSVAALGGKWGVVCCRDALGAFDARSEAWCGRGDDRSFPSREAAEEFARRMSGSSYDGTGYEALEMPAAPALAVTAGAVRSAIGPVRFGVIDWASGPGEEIQTGDSSAFGAAAAFVSLVGNDRALSAIEAL